MDDRLAIAVISEPGKAGVKTHVVHLLSHLDLRRFRIIYYYSLRRSDTGYAGTIAELSARGIECIELPMHGSISLLADLRSFIALVRSLRRTRPAILHLHSSKAGGLGRIAALCLRLRPKVFYTPHAMACYRSKVYCWLERALGLLTDVLIAVSPSERQDFIRWRIPRAEQAVVIPLGIAQPAKSPAAPAPHEAGKAWLVGGCGRICVQKNALLFFQAALASLAQGKNWRFRWIGDFGNDQEAAAVKSLLDEAGWPEAIEVTGWVSEPEGYLASLDVFCMFSRYESFGYVTGEAMLLGVPVLATPASGTVDLIQHEVTGLLVAPEVPAIMAALDRLLADPVLRTDLARRAAQFIAANHTIEGMVAATEQLYTRGLSA